MPRRPRLFLPGQAQHVIQRGHNRARIFAEAADYEAFLDLLRQAATAAGLALHAYVLMTNHVHLLATPAAPDSLPKALQRLGGRYARYVNDRHGRSGTLWEGRYRAALIDSERYLLGCYRYIELNPARAGLVRHPRDYRWSSYRRNALGEADALIAEHPLYGALAGSADARREAYRALVDQALAADVVDDLRRATNGGWALGSDRFLERVARAVGAPAGPSRRGRPRRPRAHRPGTRFQLSDKQ